MQQAENIEKRSIPIDSLLARNEREEPHRIHNLSSRDGWSRLSLNGLATTRKTSLELPSDIPIGMWKHIGEQISVITEATSWWQGDWLIYGEQSYPNRYERAIAATHLDYQTLRNYAWVCRRFSVSRRRDKLSFQHHAEVAAMLESEQDAWLDRAEKFSWSKSALRKQLRTVREGKEPSLGRRSAVRLDISEDQRNRWQAAAERVNRTLSEWISEILDYAAEAESGGLSQTAAAAELVPTSRDNSGRG
jgi:hypothetical protein